MAKSLTKQLTETWVEQIESGFVLGDPGAPIVARAIPDPVSGVTFRLRWLPHRELRTDTAALEARGILNPNRRESGLFRDPRDPSGRHCFLCPTNVRECHPLEELVPIRAGDRSWFAGANFAWLAQNHFTVMAEEHVDQRFDRLVIEAMLDISAQTNGLFRVVFNGAHAGATIPWHLHFHITSDPFPIEQLTPGRASSYPMPVRVFAGGDSTGADVAEHVLGWESRDPAHHRVNLLVAPHSGGPAVYVILRDTRVTIAGNKGLMGGWEVAGDFAYSEPGRQRDFESADLGSIRAAFREIRPPHAPAEE